MKTIANLFFTACLGGVVFAAAQTPPVSDAAVARLSVVEGQVSTQRGAAGDWNAGAVNAPLLGGDTVATAAGARGEVQLDFADLLRLDANSQTTLATLTRSQIEVEVGQGLVDYVVLPGGEASAEIDTPNLAVHPQGAGVYRIQVNSDSETVVMVRAGTAQVSTPQGSVSLNLGQMITVEGTQDPQYQIADAPSADGFDQWNQERDQTVEDAQSWGHANRYYTGLGDLDAYGRWVYAPGYGQVWSPYEQAGWAPYSAGRWVWEPAWGWTWVSTESWGWAPYHYGRWFYYQTGWAWWPGPVMANPLYQPVWAPAYVSFIGFGGGGVSVGVGMGMGSVGWIAIGPGDPFRPWWGGVGVGVVVAPLAPVMIGRPVYANLTLMAVNPRIAGAVVMVPAGSFGRGVVVRQPVSLAAVRRAQVMSGRLPMEHTAASLRVSDRPVNVAALPRAASQPERFYHADGGPARPAPASRPGFRSFGSPGPAADAARPGQPAARGSAPAAANTGRAGWNRFNSAPARGTAQPAAGSRGAKPEKKAPPKRDGGRDGGGGSR